MEKKVEEKNIEEMTIAEVFEEAKKELNFLPPIDEVRNGFGEAFLTMFTVF